MFFAAMPWTYWMALPVLVGSLLVLIGFAAVYLQKVVEPNVRRLDALAAARTSALAAGDRGAGERHPGLTQPRRSAGAVAVSTTSTTSAGRLS